MATKVFISQPMSDKTDEEIIIARQQAQQNVEKLLGHKVEVLDSFFEDVPADATPLWYLTRSLLYLAEADIVYFCSGWEQYRGCRIERAVASEYHLHIIDEQDTDDCISKAFAAIEKFISYAEARYGKSEDLTFAKQKLNVSQLWLYRAIADGKANSKGEI